MVKRYTRDEIRALRRMPDLSRMSIAEKAAYIARSLEQSRQRIEQQSRLLAELRRRMDPDAPPAPKLGLKSLDEVRAYVDRIIKGSDDTPD